MTFPDGSEAELQGMLLGQHLIDVNTRCLAMAREEIASIPSPEHRRQSWEIIADLYASLARAAARESAKV